MARRIAHCTFVIAALLVAPAAFAQNDTQPPPGAMPPGEPPPMQQPMPPPMQQPMPPMGPGPGYGGGGGGIRAACAGDIRRLCPGVQPGGGRVVQCLMAQRVALSPPCGAQLAALRPGGGAPMGPPPPMAGMPPPGGAMPPPSGPPPAGAAPPPGGNRAAFQASCGPDARLFCAGVPRENQGVIKCLASHRAELSPTCKMYLRDARAERAQRSGAGANPPPPAEAAPPPPEPSAAPPAVPPPDNQ